MNNKNPTNSNQSDISYLAYCQEQLSALHRHLVSQRRFPHPEQGPVLRALFAENRSVIMGQCGRSYGKTEIILYIAWRFSLTHPGAETYIICPELKQAKKIYWFSRRIQRYGPRHFVAEEWESKLQLIFKNSSHIILDGCENVEALRGIKPDLVIYDEFQHHSHFFDEEVMQPNLSSGRVSLVVMGTPPKRHCYYVDFRNVVLQKIKEQNPRYAYFELPSWCNPTLDRKWLEEKKKDLFAQGKQNVWYREYEGKLLFDTESAIFPMFHPPTMVLPHENIAEIIKKDQKKLQYWAVFDPGTATCFAVLFVAYNPYTSEVFLLDEIYETIRSETNASKIWSRANQIKTLYNDDLPVWTNLYDEAAAWFETEVRSEFSENEFVLIPTKKERRNTIDSQEGRPGESLIMNAMLQKKFFVSSRCPKFVWEIEQYTKDEFGRYPTSHDHLMDCLFYFFAASNYTIRQQNDPEQIEKQALRSKRAESFQQAVDRELFKLDYTLGYDSDFYDTDPIGELWN